MTATAPAMVETSTSAGTTTVDRRVVEKLAARAATNVPGAHGVSTSGLPSLLGPLRRGTAAADADIDHDTIRLVLHIEVEWPAPVAAVARRARDEVRSTVLEFVGLDVGAVEVRVEQFVGAQPRPRPRVR